MKELVQNFKKFVNEFKFDSQEKQLEISMKLVDIILEMLTITEPVDASNVKILASFTKILSSDFCHNILDSDMVGSIYASKVVPILDYFEEKYKSEYLDIFDIGEEQEPYESEFSFFPDKNEKYSKENLEKADKKDDDVFIFKILNKQDFMNEDSYDPEESEKIFNVLKSTNSLLYFIMKSPNDSFKENVLDIMNSTKIFMTHPYGNNKFISTLIYELCDTILNILNAEGCISDYYRNYIIESIKTIDEVQWET